MGTYSAADGEVGVDRHRLRDHCEHGEHSHRQHASQGDHPGTPEGSLEDLKIVTGTVRTVQVRLVPTRFDLRFFAVLLPTIFKPHCMESTNVVAL